MNVDEDDFPKMTHKQALANKIKIFKTTRPCTICGSYLREYFDWGSSAGCHVCETPGKSCMDVKLEVKNHNKKAAKKVRDTWVIPVTYKGHNTI